MQDTKLSRIITLTSSLKRRWCEREVMPEKFNAARRVRNILERAQRQQQSTPTIEVWSNVFDITDHRYTGFGDTRFEALRCLGLLNEQVQRVKSEVAQRGVAQSDSAEAFKRIEAVVAAFNFDVPWEQYRTQITSEALSQLGIFSAMSPEDEQVVPAEAFENLKQDLDAFLAEVMNNVTDDRLRAFVVKQIRIILRAIREYPIRGAEAIKDGDADFLGTIVSEYDFVREHKGEEVVKKTISFRERMRELLPWLNLGINVSRLLTSGPAQKMLEGGAEVLEHLS